MARTVLCIMALVLMLTACGSGAASAPTPTKAPASAEDVAREFVTALGAWNELALRRIAVPGMVTDISLASDANSWQVWTPPDGTLGPQTSVEVTKTTVDGDRAEVVVRSLHVKGESGVRLILVQMDGVWRVETWKSYIPAP
jgi:hypothetical protein